MTHHMHQDVLLEYVPAKRMQLVPTHFLPEEYVILEGWCRQVEELADDVLVFNQLESSLWCHLDAGAKNMFHEGLIQELRTPARSDSCRC